jgi:3-polyprenyl-4-hydroxybenzoate decarboxylase
VTVESAFVSTTGASDAPYTVRLTETLVENDVLAKVCVSEMGEKEALALSRRNRRSATT